MKKIVASILIKKFFSPLGDSVKRIWRARLRRIMRGYRVQKQAGRLDRIAAAKQALTEQPLSLTKENFSPVVMGAGTASGEIIVRQYLLIRVGGVNLNCALLSASANKRGSVVFPLPKEWRSLLRQQGFRVAHIRSGLLWQLYLCAAWMYGMVQIARIVFAGIMMRKEATRKRHVCFVDLGPGNLPQQSNGGQSYDVISWYLQWPGREAGIEAVRHTVRNAWPVCVGGIEVMPAMHVLPELGGMSAILRYVLWGMCASAIAAFDLLRGRWWHALLLNQAALAAQVRVLPAEVLAKQYLFHNSGWIYRPLWTYDAEQRGSGILFYFYSANCESFKRPEGYPSLAYGWKAMTWPRYLVWDEYQADFVRRAVGWRADISIVGPIWFQSSATEMPILDRPGVAIFDVTPFRQSRYCILGLDYDFYLPDTSKKFLAHIAAVASQLDAVMLWKRKRKIGVMAHPQYRHFAEKLSEQEHVVLVDPEISALRVIESSCAVVSMPYTSTALIARAMGKPSIYYDPTGLLQRDDRAAHGIPILSGTEELNAWLSLQINPWQARNG